MSQPDVKLQWFIIVLEDRKPVLYIPKLSDAEDGIPARLGPTFKDRQDAQQWIDDQTVDRPSGPS